LPTEKPSRNAPHQSLIHCAKRFGLKRRKMPRFEPAIPRKSPRTIKQLKLFKTDNRDYGFYENNERV
jgi:hypothetical protein